MYRLFRTADAWEERTQDLADRSLRQGSHWHGLTSAEVHRPAGCQRKLNRYTRSHDAPRIERQLDMPIQFHHIGTQLIRQPRELHPPHAVLAGDRPAQLD